MWRAAVAVLLLGLCGCEEQVYVCESDASCVWLGVQGLCLSAGFSSYCAFPASKCLPGQVVNNGGCCQSGWRWHQSAPMLIDEQCVDPAQVAAHGGAVATPDGGGHTG